MDKNSKTSTRKLVLCAILTATVVILQLIGAVIRFGPFSISLVLVPIVIGATACSTAAGAWLGLVFGIVVLITDSAAFMAVNPIGTVVTVLAKGLLAGYVAGLVYNALQKINRYAAVVAAAIVCPVVNTGVFLLGCTMFFMDTMQLWAKGAGLEGNVASYMIFVLVGVNFIVEVVVNMILSPIIVRLLNFWKD